MISFIIPCLDEEKRIASVIKQFGVLKGKYDYEVIIGDGGSTDKTVKIAKKHGANVFQNKRENQNIAKNRNLGAKYAKGDILVFCDADTKLSNPLFFTKTIISKFEDTNIVGGVPKIRVLPKEEKNEDKLYLFILNLYCKESFKTKKPIASGQCQIIRRSTFEKIKGYNEKLAHGEDGDLIMRLGKIGKLYFFSNLTIYESARRYRKWGYSKLITTAAANLMSRAIFKKDILKEWERVE